MTRIQNLGGMMATSENMAEIWENCGKIITTLQLFFGRKLWEPKVKVL
jgi:hypothetical protein